MTSVEPDVPEQKYRRLRKIIPRKLQPFLRGVRKRIISRKYALAEPYRSVFPYTQVHPLRQECLFRLAQRVEADHIEGAIVECGVLDGGTAALMAYATKRSGRAVHLFDSWQGLPAPTAHDGLGAEAWSGDVVGSPKRVKAIMAKLGVESQRLHFHPGWFSDTFPNANIDKIALLHVDCDFYDSVKLTLENWTPRVARGGYIQMDDYSAFVGCRRAVDDFLAGHPDLVLETYQNTAFFIRL